MTISNTASITTQQGDGANKTWNFNFLIPEESDMVVTLTQISTSQSTVLNETSFSVTGIGDPNGGALTYPLSGAAISNDFNITIERLLPEVQSTDLVNQGGYYPQSVEDALDYLTMITQQLQAQVSRALAFPPGTVQDVPGLIASIENAAPNAVAAQTAATQAANSAAQILAVLPVGIEMSWPGGAAPNYWFLEYGQTLNRAAFPELWAVAQASITAGFVAFGSGDGVTTFTLPDSRGKSFVGRDNMGGAAANKAQVTLDLTTTIGSVNATVPSNSGLFLGMAIACPSVPAGAKITAFTGATGVTLSVNATATGTNSARFSPLTDAQVIGSAGGELGHLSVVQEMPLHTHGFTGNALPPHTHDVTTGNTVPAAIPNGGGGSSTSNQATFTTTSVSGGTPSGTNSQVGGSSLHNNLPPSTVRDYIIYAGRPTI